MSVKGRALQLCPLPSNVDLLRYGEGIVYINAEVPHRTLYLGVTKQKLDGAQIAGAPMDQCRLEGASCKAMSAFSVAIRCKADMCFCAAHVRF